MPRQRRTKRARPNSPGAQIEEEILHVLAAAPKPLGAYGILSEVSRLGERRVYPIRIYHALDRLTGAGLVQRVETLAGYMLRPEEPTLVLICIGCGAVAQTDGRALHRSLREAAERKGFAVGRIISETLGLCAACAAAEA
jgi:Fur family zinc uptake transcriptional regulator